MKPSAHSTTTDILDSVNRLPTAALHPYVPSPQERPRTGTKRRLAIFASMLAFPLLTPSSSRAVVLNWNSVTWTAGSFTQSFDIDPTHPGNDITVTFSLSSGAAFQNNNPSIGNTFTGGPDTTNKALNMNIDLANAAAFVRVKVDFLYAGGVNNANFTLFDVDRSAGAGTSWQDQVRYFSGQSVSNNTIMPTSVTGSSGNAVTYSPGTTGYTATGISNIVNSGAGSQNANVGISYGQSYIKSMYFDYGSGSGVQLNPDGQGIGLGGISFTPSATPEINPSAGAMLGCFGGLLAYTLRRRRNDSSCASANVPS